MGNLQKFSPDLLLWRQSVPFNQFSFTIANIIDHMHYLIGFFGGRGVNSRSYCDKWTGSLITQVLIMFVCKYNPAKIAHHNKIFIKAIHLKCF